MKSFFMSSLLLTFSSLKLQRAESSLGPYCFVFAKQKQRVVCVVLRPHSRGSLSLGAWDQREGIEGRALKVVSTGMLPLKRAARKCTMFRLTDAELLLWFNLRSPGLHLVLCGAVRSPVLAHCLKGWVLLSNVDVSLAWHSLLTGWSYSLRSKQRCMWEWKRVSLIIFWNCPCPTRMDGHLTYWPQF